MAELAFRGHHLANQLVCDTSMPSSSRSVHACPPGILKTEAYRYYFSEAVPLLSRQNFCLTSFLSSASTIPSSFP